MNVSFCTEEYVVRCVCSTTIGGTKKKTERKIVQMNIRSVSFICAPRLQKVAFHMQLAGTNKLLISAEKKKARKRNEIWQGILSFWAGKLPSPYNTYRHRHRHGTLEPQVIQVNRVGCTDMLSGSRSMDKMDGWILERREMNAICRNVCPCQCPGTPPGELRRHLPLLLSVCSLLPLPCHVLVTSKGQQERGGQAEGA